MSQRHEAQRPEGHRQIGKIWLKNFWNVLLEKSLRKRIGEAMLQPKK